MRWEAHFPATNQTLTLCFGKNTASGTRKPGLKSQFIPLWAVWLQTSHSPSLSSFPQLYIWNKNLSTYILKMQKQKSDIICKFHSLELGEMEPNILTLHTGILKLSLPFKLSKLISRNKTSNQVRSLSWNTYAYTIAEKTNFNLPAIIILQYMNRQLKLNIYNNNQQNKKLSLKTRSRILSPEYTSKREKRQFKII